MVSNYNLELGHKSFAPNREAHKMFLHVSSMAQSGCVDLPSPVHFPPVTTIQKPHSNPAVASYDLDLSVPKCSKNTFVCESARGCTNFCLIIVWKRVSCIIFYTKASRGTCCKVETILAAYLNQMGTIHLILVPMVLQVRCDLPIRTELHSLLEYYSSLTFYFL